MFSYNQISDSILEIARADFKVRTSNLNRQATARSIQEANRSFACRIEIALERQIFVTSLKIVDYENCLNLLFFSALNTSFFAVFQSNNADISSEWTGKLPSTT